MTKPPVYGFEIERLALEAIRDHHRGDDMEPVTLVELHSRLSRVFFADDVRAVLDDMLVRGCIRVSFQTGINGKAWFNGRPAVCLKAGEV